MNAPTNTREGDYMPTWSLNFNEIRQNAWRFKGDKGDFTRSQESFISDSYISSVLGVFIRWGEWNEGMFGVVHVEESLEESLDKFWR